MAQEKVSVLMSVYNGEKYLKESLESLLAQSYSNHEIIIIDDASFDSTPTILNYFEKKDARIKVFRNRLNCGLTRSLNIGLKKCEGAYIARQDADDRSDPKRLEMQVVFFEQHPEVSLLGTSFCEIDSAGNKLRICRQPDCDEAIRWQLLFFSPFCHSSVMFRRSLVESVGGYNELFSQSQDYELWGRLLKKSKGANLKQVLVFLRRHQESISALSYSNQQQNAQKIAQWQIMETLPQIQLSLDQVQLLRKWFYSPRLQRLMDNVDLLQILFLMMDKIANHSACQRYFFLVRLKWLIKFLLSDPLCFFLNARFVIRQIGGSIRALFSPYTSGFHE